MPEWDGVERRRQKPGRLTPLMLESLLELPRQLWLEYLRRGIARRAKDQPAVKIPGRQRLTAQVNVASEEVSVASDAR
ncbi:MAG TPA: hypothetical protein VJ852_00245 [Gemmatimonadaceae bacterium]|nr:hypothetical protein [Gemmatimonadaceae bacterium]